MSNTTEGLARGLFWAGSIILLALGATFARQAGYIDQDTVLRLVLGINGIMLADIGNRAPKIVAPTAIARRLTRFAGWSTVISGLIYTGFWIFAPISVALIFGTGAVALGVIATLAYCLHLRAEVRAAAGK
ncbi:MAG: ammonium transporter [Sphingomonas sp.]|uniref:ammonium transporter n=1 Tax=Sphingomonas sp. TaxID=28214 RepID=UPI001B066707|nr:ammonium transporter [Sphingomonas sp.]MBO9624430.1 ammonium transporter [Sphingomonas sp.]